jgi:L-2-hydroxyglutarate oxidase LhgO
MAERIECAVIGAGVVGLAVARRLALAGREVVVLEAETAFGTHASSRNSEVIHAGIYYPTNSLKARLCVAGRKALYRYCVEHDVHHRRIGKVIVACDESELTGLRKYKEQAELNGVDDLRNLSADELSELEPEVRCVSGFLSPSTGIVDSHGLMLSYLGDAQEHGAALALASPVLSGPGRGRRHRAQCRRGRVDDVEMRHRRQRRGPAGAGGCPFHRRRAACDGAAHALRHRPLLYR